MYHIIANPAARSGKGKKLWDKKIEPYLKSNNIEYEIHFSKEAGDIANITRSLLGEKVNIVIVGGDGSVNELVNSSDDLSNVTLGLVPCGSGNDFAKGLGIPKNTVKALDIVFKNKQTKPLDIGELSYTDKTSRRFAVSCGIGFDAAVCEEAARTGFKGFLNKLGLGKLIYGSIALKKIFAAQRTECKLKDEESGQIINIKDLFFLTAMNTAYEGGGFKFAPDADPHDGKLSLCIVSNISSMKFFRALPSALSGKHFRYKGIEPLESSKVTVICDDPMWIHTDGEVEKQSAGFTAHIIPGALNVFIP